MIENPPLIQIKKIKPENKPTSEQIALFQNVPTGFICDALEGYAALNGDIKLLDDSDKKLHVVGSALTVDSGAADVLGMQIVLNEIKTNDIIVNTVNGWQETASVGDSIIGMIRNNGGKAIVTDGPIRDYNGVIETKVPCFCTGINPNSPYNSGPAKIGFPITIGGMSVKSGDLIVGDIDGVAVVPFERIDEIAQKVQRVSEIEKGRDAEVQNGLKIPQKIVELINSDKVKYYDQLDIIFASVTFCKRSKSICSHISFSLNPSDVTSKIAKLE